MGANQTTTRIPTNSELAVINELSHNILTQTNPNPTADENTETLALLKRLWNALVIYPDDKYVKDFQPIHPIYLTLGFQSPNPLNDLRAGGNLSLMQLVYFAETYNDVCRELIETSVATSVEVKAGKNGGVVKRDKFPFATVGINITYNLANIFDLTKNNFDHDSCHRNYWRLFRNTTSYNDVYVFLFKLVSRYWSEFNATLMDFADVLGHAIENFDLLLKNGPDDVLDLIKWSECPPLSVPILINDVGRESCMTFNSSDETVKAGYLWYLPRGDDIDVDDAVRIYGKEARKSFFEIVGGGELRWRETKIKGSPIRGGLKFTGIRRIFFGVGEEGGGNEDNKIECFTIIGWDGQMLVLRADSGESAGKWVKSLNKKVFEFGVGPGPGRGGEGGEGGSRGVRTGEVVGSHRDPLSDETCAALANYAISDDIDNFRSLAIRNGRVLTKLKTVMDGNRTNLLHLCCKNNSHRVLDFLVSNKSIGLDEANGAGEAPLFVAVASKNLLCVRHLLNCYPQASLEQRGIGGSSCVHVASGMGEVEILREIVEQGGHCCCYDMAKRTPLHYVCTVEAGGLTSGDSNRRTECLLFLLDSGASDIIDEVDSLAGDTALMAAARSGWVEGVRALLQTAADCSIENTGGCTANDIATLMGHGEVCELLAEYGRDCEHGPQEKGVNLTMTDIFNSSWTQFHDEGGNAYIFNEQTGESKWGYLDQLENNRQEEGEIFSTPKQNIFNISVDVGVSPREGLVGGCLNVGDGRGSKGGDSQFSSPRASNSNASTPRSQRTRSNFNRSPANCATSPQSLHSPHGMSSPHGLRENIHLYDNPSTPQSQHSHSPQRLGENGRPHHYLRRAYDDSEPDLDNVGHGNVLRTDISKNFAENVPVEESEGEVLVETYKSQRRKEWNERRKAMKKKRGGGGGGSQASGGRRTIGQAPEVSEEEIAKLKREKVQLEERLRALELNSR